MSDTYRIVRSTVTEDSTVRIAIDTEPMPEPGPDEVVVAVEAALPRRRRALHGTRHSLNHTRAQREEKLSYVRGAEEKKLSRPKVLI